MAKKRARRSREDQLQRLLQLGTDSHYLDAALYDFEYRDHEHDVDWYRNLCAARSADMEVLELGAGTGRITLPVAEDGHRVLALDRMPSMLEELGAKLEEVGPDIASRVEPRLGDMCEIPVEGEAVGMVIAPFNALMHLYSWQQLMACFREVHRVLVPQGVFGFDVLLPDPAWLTLDESARHMVTRFRHPVSGERLVYSTNHTYDHETQVAHIRIFYDDAPPAGRKFRPPQNPKQLVHLAHRQIWPEELRALLTLAGFEIESHDGDFVGISLNAEVESQCVVARKL